ncbi:MAG: SHOCT domain-containing protein, partial [Candidatus Rariloculaceae bacterium]
GRDAAGSIASVMGGKIVASAVFIDFGITDAITDMHRQYAASFVIPIEPREDDPAAAAAQASSEPRSNLYSDLETLDDLRARGILTEAEFETEKARLLDEN